MKVVLAYPYTDADGKDHAPDSTVNLDDSTASQLVADGLARREEDDHEDLRAPKKAPANRSTVDTSKQKD